MASRPDRLGVRRIWLTIGPDVAPRVCLRINVPTTENAILLDPPGFGETPLAIGLGAKATQAGYFVLFPFPTGTGLARAIL